MSMIHCIQDVVKQHLCISCGACVSAAPQGSMEMVFDRKQGILVPKIIDKNLVSGKGKEFNVCPGRGVPIKKIASDLYDGALHNTFELGYYRLAIAAHSTDRQILKNASSGGVMTHIAYYLLEQGLVDGVTASRFVYGQPGPRIEVFIARSRNELLSAQGSKYCPTNTNSLIPKCIISGGRYLFIGTPCQVAALRLAIQEEPALKETFPYTMANFCGGYRNFSYLDDILSICGLKPAEIESFRFRGGGQPGSMLAVSENGKTVNIPYPDYVGISTIPKLKRCWYCIDATGELADFACGDAWIDKLMGTEKSWSIILARSRFAEKILKKMIDKGLLETRSICVEEILYSQRYNLDSKKTRQYKRRRVSSILGILMPEYDIELPRNGGRYLHEIWVLFGKTPVGLYLRKVRNRIKK